MLNIHRESAVAGDSYSVGNKPFMVAHQYATPQLSKLLGPLITAWAFVRYYETTPHLTATPYSLVVRVRNGATLNTKVLVHGTYESTHSKHHPTIGQPRLGYLYKRADSVFLLCLDAIAKVTTRFPVHPVRHYLTPYIEALTETRTRLATTSSFRTYVPTAVTCAYRWGARL